MKKTLPIIIFIFISGCITALTPLIGAVIFVATLVIVSFLIKPIYGFFLTYLLVFLHNVNIQYYYSKSQPPDFYQIILIFVYLMSFVVFLKKVFEPNTIKQIRLNYISVLLLFYITWATFSLFWTVNIHHGVNVIFKLLAGIMFYFIIIYFIRDKEKLEQLFRILIPWGVLLGILLFISNKVEIEPFIYKISNEFYLRAAILHVGRRAGGFADSYDAAAMFSLFIFSVIALYPKVKKTTKVLFALVLIFFFICLLDTGTKGGVWGVILAVLFFLLTYPGLRKKIIITIPSFMISLILIILFSLTVFKGDRFITSTKQNILSLTSRLTIWESGFEMISKRWIGSGAGGFSIATGQKEFILGDSHNIFLATLFELGIVGFIIFTVVIISILLSLRRSIEYTIDEDLKRYLYCMLSLLIGFLIQGTVILHYFFFFFWVLIGTIIATINIAEKIKREEKADSWQ